MTSPPRSRYNINNGDDALGKDQQSSSSTAQLLPPPPPPPPPLSPNHRPSTTTAPTLPGINSLRQQLPPAPSSGHVPESLRPLPVTIQMAQAHPPSGTDISGDIGGGNLPYPHPVQQPAGGAPEAGGGSGEDVVESHEAGAVGGVQQDPLQTNQSQPQTRPTQPPPPPSSSSSSSQPPPQPHQRPPQPQPQPRQPAAPAKQSTPPMHIPANQIPPGGAPARRYLNENVTPTLLEGMKMLAREQPKEPLLVLAKFLEERHREMAAAAAATGTEQDDVQMEDANGAGAR